MINTFSNQSNLHQHQQITKSNHSVYLYIFSLNWSNVFHWEIIWSFLQGSLGLTQKQHCIRCRFYKVYLINYKTTTFSFFSFSFFFWGGGVVVFVFVVVFLVFFVKTWNACNLNYSHVRNINTSVSVYTNAEYSWKYLIQPWPWAIDILLWIFFPSY